MPLNNETIVEHIKKKNCAVPCGVMVNNLISIGQLRVSSEIDTHWCYA